MRHQQYEWHHLVGLYGNASHSQPRRFLEPDLISLNKQEVLFFLRVFDIFMAQADRRHNTDVLLDAAEVFFHVLARRLIVVIIGAGHREGRART